MSVLSQISVRARPILFSAPMVRAIISGTKTQTRRLIDPRVGHLVAELDAAVGVRCPYGQPGDRLWVRETWSAWKCVSWESDEWDPITREVRMGESWADWIALRGKPDAIEYRATSACAGPWTPAIHMPRWASRLLLEVTEVRVERLQGISEPDARCEGIRWHASGYHHVEGLDIAPNRSARAVFEQLWDAINGKRAPWSSNPWLWVVSFKRVEVSHG